MDPQPDGVSITDDWTLVRAARAGDRLAFGLLYLRHHAAAWRVACVASRFSPDAELAVIEGFTRIFSAVPEESEEFSSGAVSFRPYVLACVRQSALERARAAGRAEVGTPSSAPPSALAGLGPDGEVVLSTLEHHVARAALATLPERSRTALWLTHVEAMTPAEVAGILVGEAADLAALAASARAELHLAQESALDRQEVRAECRCTVERLDDYGAGTLDPAEGLGVRSHLEQCLPCRMRQGELANAPAALAAAVPAPPLLGGEAQHHWLTIAPEPAPAGPLLPPGLAAGGAAPRAPRARLTAGRLSTAAGAALSPARHLPGAVRRAGRAAADHWRNAPGSIDLTTRSALLRASGGSGQADPTVGNPRAADRPSPGSDRNIGAWTAPEATALAGSADATALAGSADAADPTVPPGWTASPGWSGTPVPSLPPAWTIPPGRGAGGRRGAPSGRRLRTPGGARDSVRGRRSAGGDDVADGTRLRAGGRPLALGGGLLVQARRTGRIVRPALPALSLVVAWFLVMAMLPWLVTPGTAPGPGGLALPAVQAFVPDDGPGAAGLGTTGHPGSSAAKPSVGILSSAGGTGTTEFAAGNLAAGGLALGASAGTVFDDVTSAGTTSGGAAIDLIATTASHPARPGASDPGARGRPAGRPLPAPGPDAAGPLAPVLGPAPAPGAGVAPASLAPVAVAATPTPGPALTAITRPATPAKTTGRSGSKPKQGHGARPGGLGTSPAPPAATPGARTGTVPGQAGITTLGRRDRRSKRQPQPGIVTA